MPASSTAEITAVSLALYANPELSSVLTPEDDVQGLKGPSEDWQIPGGEDRGHDYEVGDGRGTGILPLEMVNVVPVAASSYKLTLRRL